MMEFQSSGWVLLLLCLMVPGAASLEWNTPLQDWATIYLTEGEDLTIDWDFVVEEGETVEEIRWRLFLEPPFFHEIAAQDLKRSEQPFYVRDFYDWGEVSTGGQAWCCLTPTVRGGGMVQVEVGTTQGRGGAVPPSHPRFVRNVKYVINGTRAKTAEEIAEEEEKERRRKAFSSLYPASLEQIEDCTWCAEPWRRRVVVHNNARANRLSALPWLMAFCVAVFAGQRP